MLNAWPWNIEYNQNCLLQSIFIPTKSWCTALIHSTVEIVPLGMKPSSPGGHKWIPQMDITEPQVTHLCCIYAAHICVLPLKYHLLRTLAIPWWQVGYSRSSSPWKCDTIPQDHKPTTWWQINSRVLPWTGPESALWLPLPAMVLCSAVPSECVQNVRFIAMRSCRMMPQTKEDGEEDAPMGPWSQPLLVVP